MIKIKKTQSKKYLTLMIGVIIAGSADIAQATTERVSVATEGKQSSLTDEQLELEDQPLLQIRSATTQTPKATSRSHIPGHVPDSFDPDISADSRFVAFESLADNFAGKNADGTLKDTNGSLDIFVHDRRLHTTKRVNVDSLGKQSTGPAYDPSISEDGRYIAFASAATDLVIDDTDAFFDIFVRDMKTGITKRISVAANGTPSNGNNTQPFISNNGRYVSFTSAATNLLGNKPDGTAVDSNGVDDIYRVDLHTGDIIRVSFAPNAVDGTPVEANGDSRMSSMTTTGRYVAFASDASNLIGVKSSDPSVSKDTNGVSDVFWVDVDNGETFRASVDSGYTEANGPSGAPVISSDGRYIAFQSAATNLVKGDSNAFTDIFVHETLIDQPVKGGETKRVSINSKGLQANGPSTNPDINGHGDAIVFESTATNLISDDTNTLSDIFVHKPGTGETKRLSVDNNNNSKTNESNGTSNFPSIASYGSTVAFESEASNLLLNNLAEPDSNLARDIFISYVNRKPDFYIANQTVCKNAGRQDAYILQNVSDGDYLGQNQSLAYTTVSNSNPDLFGGLLGANGEPFGSWPSNVINYQPRLNASGTAEICINAKDNGGTYCKGEDNSTHCFNITVDASCDDRADELFKVDFPNLYLDFARGRNLFDQSKSGYSYIATINNKGASSSEPATFKLAVEHADTVTTTDSRCRGETLTGEYVCQLDGVPAGKTEIAFKVRASNPDDVRASVIEVQPGNTDVENRTDTGAADSSQGAGGGSLGWFSLLGLALLRRRR